MHKSNLMFQGLGNRLVLDISRCSHDSWGVCLCVFFNKTTPLWRSPGLQWDDRLRGSAPQMTVQSGHTWASCCCWHPAPCLAQTWRCPCCLPPVGHRDNKQEMKHFVMWQTGFFYGALSENHSLKCVSRGWGIGHWGVCRGIWTSVPGVWCQSTLRDRSNMSVGVRAAEPCQS